MNEIARVRYTHDAIIDEILINPSVSQGELSKQFGFTQTWISIVVNSNAFQERLAERKGMLIDPAITATINARLDAIAKRSLDKIIERLDSPTSGSIKTHDLVAIAKLGVGDKNVKQKNFEGPQTNLYVFNLPPPASDSKTWLANANPRGVSDAKIIQPRD